MTRRAYASARMRLAGAGLLAVLTVEPSLAAAEPACSAVTPQPVTPECSSSRDCECVCCDPHRPCYCERDGRTPCLYCPPSAYHFDDRYVFAMTRQLRRADLNPAGTVVLAPFTIVADTAFLPFALIIGAFG